MTVHLVTFASDDMSQSRELCTSSARQHGCDTVGWHGPWSFTDTLFPVDENLRGCGYWVWKPAIIFNTLARDSAFIRQVREGDVIIYADAGVEFIDDVKHIIERMDQDIFLFGNMYEHAHWCKRDVIEAVFPSENPPYMSSKKWSDFGKQVQASVIFFKVTDYSKAFVKEWLDLCLTPGLIDDSPSVTPNHPEFQEHRHDQAILTTLAYREGLKLHWWPASYNNGAFIYERGDYPDEGYPCLFSHHRKRNHEWSAAA